MGWRQQNLTNLLTQLYSSTENRILCPLIWELLYWHTLCFFKLSASFLLNIGSWNFQMVLLEIWEFPSLVFCVAWSIKQERNCCLLTLSTCSWASLVLIFDSTIREILVFYLLQQGYKLYPFAVQMSFEHSETVSSYTLNLEVIEIFIRDGKYSINSKAWYTLGNL